MNRSRSDRQGCCRRGLGRSGAAANADRAQVLVPAEGAAAAGLPAEGGPEDVEKSSQRTAPARTRRSGTLHAPRPAPSHRPVDLTRCSLLVVLVVAAVWCSSAAGP